VSDFLTFSRAHGLIIDELHAPGRVMRCGTTDKPRSKNGAWFWDGRRGWVSDWAAGGDLHWFDGGDKQIFTPEQKKAWAQKKRSLEAMQQTGWQQAAHKAALMLRDCELKEHNYLHSKGFPATNGFVDGEGRLLVPMRNVMTNAVQGLQTIAWIPEERRYIKKMMHGMRAREAVFKIGPQRPLETVFCEGYATALSIEAATRQMRLNTAVVACFSDGNMAAVAAMHKGRAYCIADNDASGAGQRAAEKAGLPYVMSETIGYDANDEHQKNNLMNVCKLIMKARKML
jgi:putative DNA primase/helicase